MIDNLERSVKTILREGKATLSGHIYFIKVKNRTKE